MKHATRIFTIGVLFTCLCSLAHAQNFDIYISDAGNFNNPPWQILKFDSAGQNPQVFIGSGLDWPQDILFLDGTGTVLISKLNSGIISIYDEATGNYISDFATGISGPTRMKIGPDGLLYVLQWSGNGKVLRYELNGNPLGPFTSVGVPASIGLDWDAAGNLYVSSYSGKTVRSFDPVGNDMGLFVNSNLQGPTNIWFESTGDLLVSDFNSTSVKRFDSGGNYQGIFITGLGQSEGVAMLPNGNILIGVGSAHSVKEFTAAGTYIQDRIAPGSGNLLTPNAVVVRNQVPTALPEYGFLHTAFCYPDGAYSIRISEEAAKGAAGLEFFDSAGNQVLGFPHPIPREIQSGNLATGLYICRLRLHDGTYRTQKIRITQY